LIKVFIFSQSYDIIFPVKATIKGFKMKKITLERVLYKNYLRTSLVSIFLIELFLVCFYFIINKNMIDKSANLLFNDVENSISLIVENRSQTITEESLDSSIHHFAQMKLPYDGKILIIDNFGKILFVDEQIQNILNLQENKINIFSHQDLKIVNYFKEILKERNLNKIVINKKNYLLFSIKVPKNSTYVVAFISEDNILDGIQNLGNYYEKLAYIMAFSVLIFFILFFFYISFKAKEFSDKINQPLLKIIEFTKNLGMKKDIKSLEPCGVFEIDRLSCNFNNMIVELDRRTNKLILEETKRIYQERLANTDPLTGAYNRRYLNEFSFEYLKIVKREDKDLSLLLLDLDDFKIINDSYGHEIGDIVIKELVKISKQSIRESDLVVRFGGDEFIVLLPNTNILSARLVANKIMNKVNEYNEDKEYNFSISIGTSYYQSGDTSIDDLIARADDSLYEAKRVGKNRVV
jgi:two-component system, cell cycle response regulator